MTAANRRQHVHHETVPDYLLDEYREEAAKWVVRKNTSTLVARIRGITDPGLLDDYLHAELDRPGHTRREVIGAINQRKTELATDGEPEASG